MSIRFAWIWSNILGFLSYSLITLALIYGWGLKPVSWPAIIILYFLVINIHFLAIGCRSYIFEFFEKGKPGKIVKYFHHGRLVAVDKNLKGKHRDHCLCFRCSSFIPGSAFNCQIADRVYEICLRKDLVTPVWECPSFVEGKPDLERLEGANGSERSNKA